MLPILNAIQLILYIALLAFAGQGLLFVLAGARRESNLVYGLLRVLTRPFTAGLRRLTPRRLSDASLAWLAFGLLLLVYGLITWARIDWCVSARLLGQPGCR